MDVTAAPVSEPWYGATVSRLGVFAVPLGIAVGLLASAGVFQTLSPGPVDSAVLNADFLVSRTVGHIALSGISFAVVALVGVPLGILIAIGGRSTRSFVFLLANLIHYYSPEQNQDLLWRVRKAARPGSALLLADFWTNPAHTEPRHAALMAGEFAVHVGSGDVYSADEVRAWLDRTGWRFASYRPLAGPQSLIIAKAS